MSKALEDFASRHGRLRQFFGTYFHQDWRLDYADEYERVRQYAEDHAELRVGNRALVELVVEDLRDLVEKHRHRTNAELWQTITKVYRSCYTGEHLGEDARAWVESLARELEK